MLATLQGVLVRQGLLDFMPLGVYGMLAMVLGMSAAIQSRWRQTQRNNQTVLDHITILEKTGKVDFEAIANEVADSATASPTGPAVPAPGVVVPSAPAARAGGDVRVTSRPSPGAPGTVNTARPDPVDSLGVLGG